MPTLLFEMDTFCTSPRRVLRASCLVAVLCGAAAVRAMDATTAAPVELSVTRSDVVRADGSVATPALTAQQTVLWAGRGRLAIGVGIEQPVRLAPDTGWNGVRPAQGEGRLLLGVSLRTSDRSRVVWHAPDADPGPAARPALDVRRSEPYRNLLRGTLRYRLSAGTEVALKLRGRRLGVVLTSQW